MDAQHRYVKVKILGFTIEKPAPDPKTKPRRRRNRGGNKQLSYYATINGIGLKDIELLNRVANKAHGVIPQETRWFPSIKKNANKKARQAWKKERVKGQLLFNPMLGEFAMAAIDILREHPFRNPDHISAGPDLRREGERVRGKLAKDYSGYPSQKKAKAAYKAAKGRRSIVATPRQSPWVVPKLGDGGCGLRFASSI